MREARERAQRVEVCQLFDVVALELQVREQRDRVHQRGLYRADAVAGQEESADARAQGEVAQHLDVVVDQVDGILRLQAHQVSIIPRYRELEPEYEKREQLTPATPKFSMAGILCPVRVVEDRYQLCSSRIKSVVSALFATYLGGQARAPSAR